MSVGTQGSILLVEDNPTQRRLYGDLLETQGYTVFAASSVKEAEPFLLDRLPSLILLDIMMPDVDGIEACHRFRQRIGERVPILFLTAADTVDMVLSALKAGGDDYIVKSVGIGKVVERVRYWRSASLRENLLARRKSAIEQIERRLQKPQCKAVGA